MDFVQQGGAVTPGLTVTQGADLLVSSEPRASRPGTTEALQAERCLLPGKR